MPKSCDFITIVIPCFNEAENIVLLCERIKEVMEPDFSKYEILLVDDKSTDNTLSVMKEVKEKDESISVITHESNQGIAGAWNSGVRNALGDYIVIIDADLQYNPKDILKLYKMLKYTGADVVQGVRCNTFSTSFLRKFLSKVFAVILNLMFLNFYRDIKSGFLICRKEIFMDVLKENKNYRCFQHFIGIAFISLGYKMKQVIINFDLRNEGESFITSPLFFSLNALKDFPFAFLHFNFLRFLNLKKRVF